MRDVSATDFLYYNAIALEKKERRVLFFERNCVLGEGDPDFPHKYWVSFLPLENRKNL